MYRLSQIIRLCQCVEDGDGASEITVRLDGGVCCAAAPGALAEDRAVELARVFAALADPVSCACSTVAAADEGVSCDLEDPLAQVPAAISHHTKALADAGLLAGEKRGRWMMWRVVPDRLAALRAALG
jgi:ArsR family transcriptional regulator